MSGAKVIKYKFDLDSLNNDIDYIINNKITLAPTTPKTPNAVWADLSNVIGKDTISMLSQSVGTELYDIFWYTDYKGCKDLEIHKDNPGNEYSITSRFTCIFMLEGTFELTLWEDDQTTEIEKLYIRPGEFVVLNFCQYYHSGKVIDGNKRSLHFYPKFDSIDNANLTEKIQVEDYV